MSKGNEIRCAAIFLFVLTCSANIAWGGEYDGRVIISEPPVRAGCPGGSASFEVDVFSPPVSYQWFRDDVALVDEEDHISGANSYRLVIMNITCEDSGYYTCHITNLEGTVISEPCYLSADPMIQTMTPHGGGSFYADTSMLRIGVNVDRSFCLGAYQWFKDGETITNPLQLPVGFDVNAYFTLYDLAVEDSGNYTCEIVSPCHSYMSDPVEVRIYEHLGNAAIVPESLTVEEGQLASLEATVEGGIPPLSFQWYKAEVTKTWTPMETTGATLVFESVTRADAGVYLCEVYDAGSDNMLTNEVLLLVNPAAGEGEQEGENSLAIALEPQDEAIYTGMEAKFSINVSGGVGPLVYDWRDASGVSLGAPNMPALVIPGVTLSLNGAHYTCHVSDGSSEVVSREAVLRVYERPTTGHHTADQNLDWIIDFSELLRIIQFFNMDGLHCDAGSEDGYAPGPGVTDCYVHDIDYNPSNWNIELSELLRISQFFSSRAYHCDTGAEDGFAPGAGSPCEE
ncbi:MAG TPA: immunoglobulin domain-containing protein [Candidatus Hydrogenedentes bacterium]|nr:immunoglobulin domain-containing protein [Candidatus Hydrogenedentota bacterium]